MHEALERDAVDAYDDAMFERIDEFVIMHRAATRLMTVQFDPTLLPRFLAEIEKWGGTDRSDPVEHALVMVDQACRMAIKLDEHTASDPARDAELAQSFNANVGLVAWDLTAVGILVRAANVASDVVDAVFDDLVDDASDVTAAVHEAYALRHPEVEEEP